MSRNSPRSSNRLLTRSDAYTADDHTEEMPPPPPPPPIEPTRLARKRTGTAITAAPSFPSASAQSETVARQLFNQRDPPPNSPPDIIIIDDLPTNTNINTQPRTSQPIDLTDENEDCHITFFRQGDESFRTTQAGMPTLINMSNAPGFSSGI
jgi:hypothetical protein